MNTEHPVSALLVGEFDIQDRLILREVFPKRGWRLLEAQDRNRAMLHLARDAVQVVVTEFDPPYATWKTLIQDLQRRGLSSQLVVTSRACNDSLWAEVLNLGGYDLLLSQPLDRAELERAIASAARHAGIAPGRWRADLPG
jgi:DNA-binding NtrC family response regulator